MVEASGKSNHQTEGTGVTRVSVYFKEYVVRDFLKVVVICSEEPHAVGDLPGLPYCFSCDKSISIGEDRLCYSEEMLSPCGKRVVIEGTKILGELRSVSYVVKGINCSIDPEELYRDVSALIDDLCVKRSPQTSE